ncbi:MAG: hypothetical protein M3Y59_19815 [Myxococcota bacterium]|nr:hypothetical protein [Myxococcota bacterium]
MHLLRTCGVLGLILLSGCAALQRESRAREFSAEHVYPRPLAEVWPHVIALLASQGYTAHLAAGDHVLETDWKQEVSGARESGAWSRYVVVGKDGGDSCVVRILKNTREVESAQRGSEAADDQVATNDGGGGRSVERSIYGTPTDAAGPLRKDEEESGGIAAGRSSGSSSHGGKAAGIRDLHLEWLLIQRADPAGAAKIYSRAEGN